MYILQSVAFISNVHFIFYKERLTAAEGENAGLREQVMGFQGIV